MACTRFALILYFRMVAHSHKAACHTTSNAFLKFIICNTDSADVDDTFHTGF